MGTFSKLLEHISEALQSLVDWALPLVCISHVPTSSNIPRPVSQVTANCRAENNAAAQSDLNEANWMQQWQWHAVDFVTMDILQWRLANTSDLALFFKDLFTTDPWWISLPSISANFGVFMLTLSRTLIWKLKRCWWRWMHFKMKWTLYLLVVKLTQKSFYRIITWQLWMVCCYHDFIIRL